MVQQYYIGPKPKLSIESNGGASLGRCYSASYFRVTALHPLSMEDFRRLRDCGLFSGGQEFMVRQVAENGDKVKVAETLDWQSVKTVNRSGFDVVGLTNVEVPGWKIIGPSTSKMTTEIPYYTYEVEVRCDSSD